MQRYEQDPLTGGMDPNDAIGEWVRYEDAAAQLAERDAQVAALRDVLETEAVLYEEDEESHWPWCPRCGEERGDHDMVCPVGKVINDTAAAAAVHDARLRAEGMERAAKVCDAEAERWGIHAEADAARLCADTIRAAMKEEE